MTQLLALTTTQKLPPQKPGPKKISSTSWLDQPSDRNQHQAADSAVQETDQMTWTLGHDDCELINFRNNQLLTETLQSKLEMDQVDLEFDQTPGNLEKLI